MSNDCKTITLTLFSLPHTASGVDFLPTPSSVTIPPSTALFTAEFLTAILNDDIHEAVEGYFIIGQFSFENTDDEARFGTSPIITALIRIANDDGE